MNSQASYRVKPGDPNPFYRLDGQLDDAVVITEHHPPGENHPLGEQIPAKLSECVGVVEEWLGWEWKRIACDGFVHKVSE